MDVGGRQALQETEGADPISSRKQNTLRVRHSMHLAEFNLLLEILFAFTLAQSRQVEA